MTEAVVWLVIWILVALAGPGIIFALTSLILMYLFKTSNISFNPLAIFSGWILGIFVFGYGAVMAVLQLISVINLATA